MIIKIKPLRLNDSSPFHEDTFECQRYRKEFWEMENEGAMQNFVKDRLGIRMGGPITDNEECQDRFAVTLLYMYMARSLEGSPIGPFQVVLTGEYEVFVMNDQGKTIDRFSN